MNWLTFLNDKAIDVKLTPSEKDSFLIAFKGSEQHTSERMTVILPERLTENAHRQRMKGVFRKFLPFYEEIEGDHQKKHPILLERLRNEYQDRSHPHIRTDWGTAPALSNFYGRNQELEQLKSWILDKRCRLVGITGSVGIGKTTLGIKLAQEIEQRFQYVIWRSLRNPREFTQFIEELCQCFLTEGETNLSVNTDDPLSTVMSYLREARCLLIMDNWEQLFEPGNEAGIYQNTYRYYQDFINSIIKQKHNSCVVVTTQERLREMDAEGQNSLVYSLSLKGLESDAARAILQNLIKNPGEETLIDRIIGDYRGHPSYLKVVYGHIINDHNGSLREFFKHSLILGDIQNILEVQWHRLTQLEKEVMYYLARTEKAVSYQEIRDNIIHPSNEELRQVRTSLSRRSLVEITSDNTLTLDPVVTKFVKIKLNSRQHREEQQ